MEWNTTQQYSNEKNLTTATQSVDESKNAYTEWKMLDSKGYRMYNVYLHNTSENSNSSIVTGR